MSLYNSIKIDHWSEFKYVFATVKQIAKEVRKEYRRKKKTLVSLIVVHPIKEIIAPLSRLMHHYYRDEAAFELLSSAVKRLNSLALDLESFRQTGLVKLFRQLADILVSFISKHDGIQLELFDPNEHDVTVLSRPVLPLFKAWLSHFDWQGFQQKVELRKSNSTPVSFYQFALVGLVVPSS